MLLTSQMEAIIMSRVRGTVLSLATLHQTPVSVAEPLWPMKLRARRRTATSLSFGSGTEPLFVILEIY